MDWAGQDVLRVPQVVVNVSTSVDISSREDGVGRRAGLGAFLPLFCTLCVFLSFTLKRSSLLHKCNVESPPLNIFLTQQQKNSGITDILSMFVTPDDLCKLVLGWVFSCFLPLLTCIGGSSRHGDSFKAC